jgi:hypothetical protein
VIVRVVTRDLEDAQSLFTRLAPLFGKGCVSLRPDGEIEVQTRQAPNGALVQTLEMVEDWLTGTSLASVEVCVDGHSYSLDRSQPAGEVLDLA